MNPSSKETNTTKSSRRHDPGALTAWGLIVGGVLGLAIGACFGQAFVGGFILATVAGGVGALIDRARIG